MKGIITIIYLFSINSILAFGMGYSSYPLSVSRTLVSTEFTGVMTEGGGIGIQLRLVNKLNELVQLEAGMGISGGQRDSRFFAASDYELFPDFDNQPRISVKLKLENAKEFGDRRNIISISPIISKGFSFWGNEGYPYISFPISLNLNSANSIYKTQVSFNTGITGPVPLKGMRNLTASAEMKLGLIDSFTSIAFGVGLPLN